jgi:RHS repeat-associated protein
MQYDSLGRLVKEENPVGGGWTLSRTQSGANYEARLTSGEGRTTRYAVEMLNDKEMKRVNTAPDGTQSVETTWRNGTTTRLQPDGTVITQKQGPDPRFGMLSPVLQELKMTLPSGLTGMVTTKREATLSATNDLSQPASLKTTMTVNGKSSKSVYTAIDQKVVTTSAAGRVTTKLLDEKGRVSQTSVPTLAPVHYTYDTRGRLTQVSQGQGEDLRTVTLSYDNSGEVSQLTDALGRAVSFAYDAVGRVTTQTLPDGRQIHSSYDANGNVTSITPPSRPQHEFDYTAVDLLSQYLPPVLPTLTTPQTVYAYNLDKQLTQITRPDGQRVTFNYGATSGRLESLTTPLGTQSLSYDNKGRLVVTTTPENQTLSYTYDGSLPVSETWNGTIAGSLSLSYNNDLRVTTASVNGGLSVTYQYDADGLLIQAGEISLTRNLSTGLLTGTQLGNVTTQRTYNAFGELASETASYQGNVLSQVQYSRDKLGRIISKMESLEGVTTTFDYSYDLAGRLVEVKQNDIVTESYEYDANGNRVQALTSSQGLVLGSYDDQDRLLEYGGNTYAYTANGELLSKTSNGQTTTYHYDVLGNLRQVQLPEKTIEYVIDGRNRRVGKKVNGTLVQGFLYQGSLKPVAELDGNGNVVARFVYGNKGNVPDYLVKEGKTYRIVSDHLGSPRWVVDIAEGSVVQKMEYDAFGNVMVDTNPNFQPFGFAGGLYDTETRLVRFGARDYDNEVGRWTAKDPKRFRGGDLELYSYTFDDPINFHDPKGKNTIAIGSGIGGTVAGPPGAVIGGIIGIGIGIGIGLYIAYNNSEVPIKELPEPLHSPETLGERPDLEGLSDEKLLDSARNPKNNNPITINTKTGSIVEGNSRVRELKKRANDPKSCITPDTTVPVDKYTPDDSAFWDF